MSAQASVQLGMLQNIDRFVFRRAFNNWFCRMIHNLKTVRSGNVLL